MIAPRAAIDAVDDELLDLLARRVRLVEALQNEKERSGQPRYDPQREAAIFDRLRERACVAGLDPDAVAAVFRCIVGKSLRAKTG